MDAVKNTVQNTLNMYTSSPDFSNSGVRPLKEKHSGAIAQAENNSSSILPCEPLKAVDGFFVDPEGRKRVLKGINVDNTMKLPAKPFMPTWKGDALNPNDLFFDGDSVSFVGRPFPLEEAEEHWNRIKSWGYNVVRYVLTWEAIEHAGPGKYDDEFVNYTIEMLKIIHKVGGLYVFLESHQDVWSRFSGGSGAPLWTFYAVGLQPTHFHHTEAAILHNDPRFENPTDPECYPKMLWPTNYWRLAALTMFTMFFAGKTYFPHLTLDGVNIQDFLQGHHQNAFSYLSQKVADAVPDMVADGTLLGFESLNEPGIGLLGNPDLGKIPKSQVICNDTAPTAYQTFLLGMGLPVEVDTYTFSNSGPKKTGSRVVDPKGVRAWLTKEEFAKYDAHYGWKRSGWTPGECIYAGLKIWEFLSSDLEKINGQSLEERLKFTQSQCRLLEPTYFSDPSKVSNYLNGKKAPEVVNNEFVLANFFVDFYIAYKELVRAINKGFFMLIQPPFGEGLPYLKDDSRGIIDDKTVFAPHHYDVMTLLLKTWNDKFNVDSVGILKGQYAHPGMAVVVGEKAIRNCIKKQYNDILNEGREKLGNVPALMTETGIPFDMDNKQAYKDGKYTSQTAALDAMANGLEDLGLNHTWWAYAAINCHEAGDHWNNEDLAFWSPDDQKKNCGAGKSIEERKKNCYAEDGVRAPSAVLRPFLVASAGTVKAVEFDLKNVKYSLTLNLKDHLSNRPTVIYVPKWHYPTLSYEDIYMSSGDVKYNEKLQYLEWYHPENAGEETIIIKKYSGKDEDVTKKEETHGICAIV